MQKLSQLKNFPRTPWMDDEQIFPSISFVIPMYNEASHIGACLQSISSQNYPIDRLQIIVVDGESTDDSVKIIQDGFIAKGVPVEILTNPLRKTPRSLNLGVSAAEGDLVVILGAHAEIEDNFLRYNLECLRTQNIVCSGGTLTNGGSGSTQRSIGETMSHPFGMTAAAHRYRKHAGLARTAAFGVYRKEIFDVVGEFDESGQMAEDAELNWRIVAEGYGIWYDPRIKTIYHPRRTLKLLTKQLYHYGLMRAQMFRKHRGGLSWLHLAPPAAVITAFVLGALIPTIPAAKLVLASLTGMYIVFILISSIYLWITKKGINPIITTLSFILIHVGWGIGFLLGMIVPKAAAPSKMSMGSSA